jgi:hypothetical protein
MCFVCLLYSKKQYFGNARCENREEKAETVSKLVGHGYMKWQESTFPITLVKIITQRYSSQ